jgi:aconitate hydratase
MSCTGKGTICNMVLKLVQTSTFGYDDSICYLRSTDRSDVADAADKVAE